MKSILAACVFTFVLTSTYAYRDCYMCTTLDDQTSSKNCDYKKPDLGKLVAVRWRDYRDECVTCYKSKSADDDVIRGCLSRVQYNQVKEEYGFNKKNGCKEAADGSEMCLCEYNLCNGVGKVKGFGWVVDLLLVTIHIIVKGF